MANRSLLTWPMIMSMMNLCCTCVQRAHSVQRSDEKWDDTEHLYFTTFGIKFCHKYLWKTTEMNKMKNKKNEKKRENKHWTQTIFYASSFAKAVNVLFVWSVCATWSFSHCHRMVRTRVSVSCVCCRQWNCLICIIIYIRVRRDASKITDDTFKTEKL